MKKKGKDMGLYGINPEDIAGKLKGTTKYGHYRHKMLKLLPHAGLLDDAGYYPFGGCTVAIEFTDIGVAIKYGVCNDVDRFVKSLGRTCAKAKKPSQFYPYDKLLDDILQDEKCLADGSMMSTLAMVYPLKTFRRLVVQKAYQKADEGLKKVGFKEKVFYNFKK